MWIIYYGDGSTFSDSDGSPFEALRTDVQVILQTHEPSPSGYCLTLGKTYYYWQDDEGWWPTDERGHQAWLVKCPPGRLQVLVGENCPDFQEILKRAVAHKKALIGSAL